MMMKKKAGVAETAVLHMLLACSQVAASAMWILSAMADNGLHGVSTGNDLCNFWFVLVHDGAWQASPMDAIWHQRNSHSMRIAVASNTIR